jgi:hypothetical protein
MGRYDSEEEDGAMTLPRFNARSSFNTFGASSQALGRSLSIRQALQSLRQGAKGSALILDCGAEDDVSNLFCNVCSYVSAR